MSGPLQNPFMFSAPTAKGAVDLLEADADSNTFVCEFLAAGGDETGVGAGLSGSDLVLTEAGTVSDASGGWRTLEDGAFRLTGTFFNTFFTDVATRTMVMHIKNVETEPSAETMGIFNWVSSNNQAAWYIIFRHEAGHAGKLKVEDFDGNANVGFGATIFSVANSFGSTDEVWLAWWQDGTYDRFGWIEGEDAPSNWSDFPSGQRVSATHDWGNYSSGTPSNYGIGINNAGITGRFEINRFIMSTSGTLITND